MKSSQRNLLGLLLCGLLLGLPGVSHGAAACSNASLTGTYTAQVSSVNFSNVFGALNNSAPNSDSGGVTGAVAKPGFSSNPLSLSGSVPGTSRFYFDGNGNIIGQDPNAQNGAGAQTNAGSYSVNSDCSATVKLATGQNFNAVVVSAGAQLLFLESDPGSGGIVGTLARSTNGCSGNAGFPQSFGFSFYGSQQVSAPGGNAVVAPAVAPPTITKPAATAFLATYNGVRASDLDVAAATAYYDGSNFTFQATLYGDIGTTKDAIYEWGVDRGAHKARFGAFRPGQFFDSVVIAHPDGTGIVFDNTADPESNADPTPGPLFVNLPAGSITVTGNTIRVVVPASMLPSKGAEPAAYTWFMSTLTSLTDDAAVSQFIPANSNASFALTSPPSGPGGTTGGVGNAATPSIIQSYTPYAAIGSVQLGGDGNFALKEWVYQKDGVQAMSGAGRYSIGADCAIQLTFANPSNGAGATPFTVPLTFRGALVNSSSGLLVMQPDAFATVTGQFISQ